MCEAPEVISISLPQMEVLSSSQLWVTSVSWDMNLIFLTIFYCPAILKKKKKWPTFLFSAVLG